MKRLSIASELQDVFNTSGVKNRDVFKQSTRANSRHFMLPCARLLWGALLPP